MNPVSSYSFFYALSKREKYGLKRISDILKTFNLFGFVIYDPILHTDIKEYFKKEFDEIDKISGSKFLFFTIIEFNDDQLSYFSGKPNYKLFKELEDKHRGIANPLIVNNADNVALSLAAHLEIDTELLPVIVLSNNLEFGDFVVVPTNGNIIENQLINIGRVARNLNNRNKDELIKALVKFGLIREEQNDLIDSSVNLNEAIFNALSSYTLNGDQFGRFKMEANSNIKNQILKIKKHINQLQDYSESKSIVEKELLKLATIYSNIKNQKKSQYQFIKSWQENSTQLYLRNFESISESDDILIDNDYSPFAICLAKAFENEINLSYFNWMRKIKGIDMPQFYNIYEKNKDIVVTLDNIENPFSVNLNINKNGKLLPPSLGQTLLCFRFFYEVSNIIPENHTNEGVKNLIEIWTRIKNLRNKIAHPVEFTKEEYDKFLEYCRLFFHDQFGEKISFIKSILKQKQNL